MDENALKTVLDCLVDPWHKSFAKGAIERYLQHVNKHPTHAIVNLQSNDYDSRDIPAKTVSDGEWNANPTQNSSIGKRVMYTDGTASREYENESPKHTGVPRYQLPSKTSGE